MKDMFTSTDELGKVLTALDVGRFTPDFLNFLQ